MKLTSRQRMTLLMALLLVVAGLAAGLTLSIPRAAFQLRAGSSISYDLHDLWAIASRNLRISLQLVLGVVSLGIYSLIQLLSLGFSLGALLSSASQSGIPTLKIASLLGPHSLIEFAGFIVLGAVEFEAAILVYQKLRYDQLLIDRQYIRRLINQVLIGFALIVLAALIEVYVTGPIAKNFA